MNKAFLLPPQVPAIPAAASPASSTMRHTKKRPRALLWAALLGLGIVAPLPARGEDSDLGREDATDGADLGLVEYTPETSLLPASSTRLTTMAMLGYKQTFTAWGNFDSFMLQAEGDHQRGPWGAYGLARLKIGDFQHLIGGSTLWLHQAYVYTKRPWGQVKVGKVLSAFGRVWDYGMYGPLVTNNDVKMIPDLGATLEVNHAAPLHMRMDYTLQYAPLDGRAVVIGHGHALRVHSRRQHIATLRVAPTWQPNPHTHATLGLSGQRFSAVQVGHAQVSRGAIDVEAAYKQLSAFAEVGQQRGNDRVVQDNILIHSHRYLWAGAQWAPGSFSLRYHFNYVGYDDAERTTEILHQPGIGLQAGPHFAINVELALWQTSRPLSGRGERALNVLAGGTF
jgi:hypothetical protein